MIWAQAKRQSKKFHAFIVDVEFDRSLCGNWLRSECGPTDKSKKAKSIDEVCTICHQRTAIIVKKE